MAHHTSHADQPRRLDGKFGEKPRSEDHDVDLTAYDDDQALHDAGHVYDPGPPPEPETVYCTCGSLATADPDGSPGVLVHVDDNGDRDYDLDEDHAPVDDEQIEDLGLSDGGSVAYPNGRCRGCGSGLDDAGRCYQSECTRFDDSSPHAGYDADDGYDDVAGPHALIAKITDPGVRAACEEYATRYAPPPTSLDYEPDWDRTHQVAARDLKVGDRLHPTQRALPEYETGSEGRVITTVGPAVTWGVVDVYCDGRPARGATHARLNHGDPVTVHDDRVDLSDPDWFEVEATRATREQIAEANRERHPSMPLDVDQENAIRERVRRGLYQTYSSTDLSASLREGGGYDPRIASGRAKVGDDVIFEQPMHGSSSYRVLGKYAKVDIAGHDGTSVVWAETGEVEYVVEDIETGRQQHTNLRGPSWLRIPAPGDTGPGTQAQRVDRRG